MLDIKQRGEANLKALGGSFDKTGTSARNAARDAEGLGSHAGRAAGDVERAGKKAEGATSRVGSAFKSLGTLAGSWGLPFAASAEKVGEKLEHAGGGAKGFANKLSALGGVTLAAGTVGVVALGVEAVNLGDKMNSAAGQVANAAGITEGEAKRIGNAFKGIKGEESATELTQAYAGVAGQLGAVQGQALTAGQAVQVMSASADLADAKLGDLGTTTGSLGKVMQAWGLSSDQAGQAADTLFGIVSKTGADLPTVTNTLQRMHSTLGAATPSLQQVGGLILDLAEHGETGRQGISAVSTATTTLLKQTTMAAASTKDLTVAQDSAQKANLAVSNAQTKVNEAQKRYDELPTAANADKLAQARNTLAARTLSAYSAEQKLADATKGVTEKLTPAGAEAEQLGLHVYNAQGAFVGWQSVIAQLQPKLAGMTEQQKLQVTQTLFGATAGQKMLEVIDAGPAAFDKATAAVNRSGAAHAAAETQMRTLHGEAKELGAEMENVGTSAGQFLIPKLTEMGTDLAAGIYWMEEHKGVAEALAGVIGGTLAVAVGAFTVNKLVAFGKGIKDAGDHLATLAKKIAGFGKGGGVDAEGKGAAEALDGASGRLRDSAGRFISAAQALEEAANRISASADKLQSAGAATAEEIDAAGTTAAGELDAAGATTAAEIDAGATTAAGELDAAGATVAAEEEAGGAGGAGGGVARNLVGPAVVAGGIVYGGHKALQAWGKVSGPLGTPDATDTGAYLGAYAAQQKWTPKQMGEYLSLVAGGSKETPQQFNATLPQNMPNATGPGPALSFVPGKGWVSSNATTTAVAPGRASGGPVTAGMPYDVSEDEIFVSGTGGHIVPLGGSAGGPGGIAGGSYTIYQIQQLIVQADNPQQLQSQLASKARRAALSGNPMGGANLGVAT